MNNLNTLFNDFQLSFFYIVQVLFNLEFLTKDGRKIMVSVREVYSYHFVEFTNLHSLHSYSEINYKTTALIV